MPEANQKAVKCPIGRKGLRNIKTSVMGNEKVVIEIINKVGYHGKTFTFHNNKRTNHSMVRKTFPSGGRVLLDGREVKIQK